MDAKALAARLEGDSYQDSRRFRKLLSGAPFEPASISDGEEYQNRVDAWCRWFSENDLGRFGLPPKMGGDPQKFLTLGYEIGLFDLSLMMRFGLQYGFALRALSRLGSLEQLEWLDQIADMRCSACFAMTERDHGSNVRALQTTATFRPEHGDFELHTPHQGAAKDSVTGLRQGSMAVVFARLVSAGQDHGVHAFVVKLRDQAGEWLPGVVIGPSHRMTALHGLDYGTLCFDHLIAPKNSLLSRYVKLDEKGSYKGLLRSESHRFNAMMGTLVVGRALIAQGAAGGAKKALYLAIRFAASRRQFGARGEQVERTLLSFQAVQKKLMPALATLLAVDAGRARLAQCQHEYLEDSVKDRELETFTAAFKAYVSQFAVETAQLCRQTCGGAGCLESSGLGKLRAELDLFTTMEGDNTVLELMVARNLLTDHSRRFDKNGLIKALSWVGKNVDRATKIGPLKSRDASSERLHSTEFLSDALRFRRESLRESLARRVKARVSRGVKTFEALNDCQDHSLSLARAYCEDKIFRCLRNLTESCPPGWDRRVLGHALSLFGLSRVEAESGWYSEQGFLNAAQSQTIRRECLELCSMLAQESSMILDAFEMPGLQSGLLSEGSR